MDLETLIKQLQAIRAEHGNVRDVIVDADVNGRPFQRSVDAVGYDADQFPFVAITLSEDE